MGKYLGASCRLCRREGEKLFLKGTRCYTHRCAIERRAYSPGQHGSSKRGKLSDYGLQLREKQKLKRIYGLLERQFKNYFEKASRTKGVTGTLLLQSLERRIDNVVYQAGFAASRKAARQIVGHGLTCVNNQRVNIPSYQMRENDEIILKFGKTNPKFVQDNIESNKGRSVPAWLEVDPTQLKIKIKRLPMREDIGYSVKEQLIVELYSK